MFLLNTAYIIVLAISLLLSIVVFFRSFTDRKNQIFGLLIFSCFFWVFCGFMADNSKIYESALFWSQIAVIGPILIPCFFVMFSKIFPYGELTITNVLFALFPSFLLIFTFTDSNVKEVKIGDYSTTVTGGWLFIAVFLIYLVYFGYGFSVLLSKYSKAKGLIKTQLQIVLTGVSITLFIGILTNIVLLLIEDIGLSSLGPISTIIMLISIAYAILRYKFLDIRLIIGRITYFVLAGSIVFFAFYLIAIFQITIFGDLFTLPGYLVGIINAIIFVMAYDTLIKFIRNKVDSTIINPGFDPDTEVSNFNNEVASLLDTNQINALTLDTFKRTVRLKALNLVVKEGGDVDIFSSEGDLTSQDIDLSIFQKLAGVFSESQKSINVDIFDAEDTNQRNPFSSKTVHECVDILKKFNVRLLVPLKQGSTVIGLLMLGPKEGDSPYNTIETDFAVSIASLVSLSLNRSFLYKEVEEFNSTLQKKVTEATSELQDKSEKLKQSLDYERDMLDILGHELRTPLSIARNAIMLIQMKMKAIPAAQGVDKEVGIAVENIRREVQLLETILASTKIDNDRLELQPEKIDAKKIIADGIRGYEQDALKKELKLTSEIPPEELFVYADKLRVQQVMDNLVSNAVKYTKAGEVKILMKDIGDMLEFKVQDTGEGIPEKDIPNLGTKFFRVNTYLESNGKIGDRKIVRPGGTGIGLYVVFQLVKAMGGTIVVTSKLGEGSTFTFTIPKYKEGMDATTGKLPSFMMQPKFDESPAVPPQSTPANSSANIPSSSM